MNDSTAKEALSYSLGSDLHEEWRLTRKLSDGTFEPRIKKSKDHDWNIMHGTDEVDIANCTFDQLPSNWQFENLEAAKVAIDLIYDKTINGEICTPESIEEMSSEVHEAWLRRNEWVFDPNYGNPAQAVSYDKLSEEEKAKDRAQVLSGINKVQDYMAGKINVEEILSTYNIETMGKTF